MTKTDTQVIHGALADLSSQDHEKRRAARAALERFGEAAVGPLIEALSSDNPVARHDVFKVLGAIAPPEAAEVFVAGLEDGDFDCRWLAAEGLIALGKEGLLRILGELTDYPDTPQKLRGAHHVLSGLRHTGFDDVVEPVLKAFLSDIAHIDVPRAALAALTKLKR